MTSLAFQPAFDVFHTEFRLLRLRRIMSVESPWHFDQVRIADFYLLFFFRLQDVRLRPKHKAIKSLARKMSEGRYENQPDDQLLFNRMAPFQQAAMNTLIAKSFFAAADTNRDVMVETEKVEPEPIARRIDVLNGIEAEQISALHALVSDYALLGEDGLKARTRLLEYRYDAI